MTYPLYNRSIFLCIFYENMLEITGTPKEDLLRYLILWEWFLAGDSFKGCWN